MRAVFAGERGSFAEAAARAYFGGKTRVDRVPLFEDVFSAAAGDSAVRGVVPIENTRGGSVHQNYDLLLESGCSIVGEIYLPIRHCLVANPGVNLRRLRRVLSHPQALAQCRRYLARRKGWTIEETVNTAAAVKRIQDEGSADAAAVASRQAALDFNMEVLAENIQDDQGNTTRFLVVADKPLSKRQLAVKMNRSDERKSSVKTSIIFSMKNLPGALFKSLAVFSLRDIDLFKIESRPTFGQGFQYLFYLDFEGSAFSEAQQNALNHLQELTVFFRMLGSYPVGRRVGPAHGQG